MTREVTGALPRSAAMLWTAAAVAAATGGQLGFAATGGQLGPTAAGGQPMSPDAAGGVFGSVVIDSRTATPGALFVALRAERDGHDFIAAAVAAGATGYLCAPGRSLGSAVAALAIEVDDPGAALLDLGRAARRRLAGPVVGITGSVGKTSTKDMAAAALRARFAVTASAQSFNNELGVPLTLANADAATEVAVVEMGARGVGHIALLCDVARPTVAVVTAVAAVHTERFGGIDAVARAKGELVEALPVDGVAVLNADDGRVAAMAGRAPGRVLRYSAEGRADADVTASGLQVGDDLRPSFLLSSPWGRVAVRLGVRGAHQVGNALAAAAVALYLGVDPAAVAAALGEASLSPWRMELTTAPSGALVLNDAYNASPTSMVAALRSLAALPATRRVAVVGVMAELGPSAAAEHRRVAAVAAELGVEVVAVDTADYGLAPVDGVAGALARLGPLGPGDAVLVKASRVAGLERLAARLLAGP
jgi:UDP-N-acetylmuramoyl-tripeptide--D-alanyl-D-alanine ligase